jgi:hypothetical protein
VGEWGEGGAFLAALKIYFIKTLASAYIIIKPTLKMTLLLQIPETKKFVKGIVSRDFVVCFLVSFDRSDIPTHQERVLLLLEVRFRIKFFNFRVRP